MSIEHLLDFGDFALMCFTKPQHNNPKNPLTPNTSHSISPLLVHLTKPRIIVVDDADSVRAIAGYVLQKAGYEVLSLKSGEEALQYFGQPLEDRSAFSQLLLTDIRMSGISGIDLARSLRHQSVYQQMPIVMMSSNFGTVPSSELAQLQLNGLVRKPLNVSNLIATVKVALATTQHTHQALF